MVAREDQDVRARLLEAAEALFGERTYAEVGVAEICSRAGTSVGSFYLAFDSKRDLFVELIRDINADLRDAMRVALESASPGQRGVERSAFEAFFSVMSKRPQVYHLVREAEFVTPEVFREYYERLARAYSRGVRQAQLAGDVDPNLDPEVVAYVYMGIGYFIGMRWAEWTGGGVVPGDVLEDMFAILDHGLPGREDGQ